jgi:acetyl-CoA/propionyl-CoA carboxylase, biotin carboxylase, biotin carboxyl carrier protein
MDRALHETVILGVTTNIEYLRAILATPAFLAGNVNTNFLAEHLDGWLPATGIDETEWIAAAVFEALSGTAGQPKPISGERPVYDPWDTARGWRNVSVS